MSSLVQPLRDEVLACLAAARAAADGVASTVLDRLWAAQPTWHWDELLPRWTGVRTATAPGLTLLSAVKAQPEDAILAQWPDGERALVMRDPWDVSRHQTLMQALSLNDVEPVAGLSQHFIRPATKSSDVPVASSPTAYAPSVPTVPNAPTASNARLGSAVDWVDRALVAAWNLGASDVHFECDRRGLTVKHRLDGVMRAFERHEGVVAAEEAISRIKVLAQLDITERRLPQDGRFRFTFDAQAAVDLRVSIMPSVFGEDAVLRLLDKSTLRSASQDVSLDSLGFDLQGATRLRELARMPHGMLLVTGPTGSGKTTTVYASLSEINTGLEKIITIEDPVEYELPGVLQIPVNEKKGLSFARGLRSILRHDPDRILVGEIRDAETAAIAVQSALTGHLVFTTVHANSLFDVIGRFRHFELDMFGFVSSLNGVVVQRLVRRLCPGCQSQRSATPDERTRLEARGIQTDTLPSATGCSHCHDTGYRGRFVLAEVHALDDRLRDRILAGADVSELKGLAFDAARGVQPLALQALHRVQANDTTLEEVARVVGQV